MSIFTYEQLHSSLNHRKTKALFAETCTPNHEPLMTLGRKPKGSLVVLRDHFLDLVPDDPTEYTFAMAVFGDYAFWEHLCKSSFMKPHLEEWREVADVARKSRAFRTIIRDAQGEKQSSASSAKFLISESWKDKRNPETKERSAKTSEKAAEGYSEDIRRLKDFM